MAELSRREMLGSLGALAAAGGWMALTPEEAVGQETPSGSRKPGEYTLPPLGYEYDALEPHIDAKTMKLHHDIHHAGYVRGLNAAIKGLQEARGSGNLDQVHALTGALAFNGSGHMLHTIFWKNMKKDGGGKPSNELGSMIDRDFGGFDKLKAHFQQAAKTVRGSGWGILAWEPLAGRLLVFGAEKHNNNAMWGVVPLLVVDVWEHAYYLKYQNERGKYLDAFWNVVDWENVAHRVSLAQQLSM